MQSVFRRLYHRTFKTSPAISYFKSLYPLSDHRYGGVDHQRYGSTLAAKGGVGHMIHKGTGGRSSVSASKPVSEENSRSFGQKAVSTALICLTGGVALSALDDLAVYHGCSSKAMEKACKNQDIVRAIGEPVVKGPWYSASLAVAHKRNSVSCTFPVSGPQGNGVLRLKAVRNGDGSWLSFLRPRDFDILILDAVLYVPGNEEAQRNIKINVSDNTFSPTSQACVSCPKSGNSDKQ